MSGAAFAPKVGDLVGFVDLPPSQGHAGRTLAATVLAVFPDAHRNFTRYKLRLHNTAPDANLVLAYRVELRPLSGSIGGAG